MIALIEKSNYCTLSIANKHTVHTLVILIFPIFLTLIDLSIAVAKTPQDHADNPPITPLKNSFVIKEGTKSGITCMVTGRNKEVYGAGISDKDLVIFRLDAKLKTIKEHVKFGSPKGNWETITDMAMDSHGNLFVAGHTHEKDFPVTKGSYDPVFVSKGRIDHHEGIVVKFSSKLKLLASTFIGGDGNEKINAIAIDRQNNIYVAGYSEGTNPKYNDQFMPPPTAFDSTLPLDGQAKAFIAKLDNNLSRLQAATFLGGNKKEYDSDDEAYDLAIDGKGNVWVVGQSNSVDFPVTRYALEPFYSGRGDVFISKLNKDLSNLLASTYLGGMNQEMAVSLVLTKDDEAFVGGWTESPDFPMVKGCYDTKYSHEEEDGFIVKVSSDLQTLKAATYLGGNYDASGYGDDLVSAMTLSQDGKKLWVTGRSESENFPITKNCYKCYTNDNNTPLGSDDHRNNKKPREASSDDSDWGDGFITQFNSDLSQCGYSTYFGGNHLEYMDDILVIGNDLLLAGVTWSHEFPRITTKKKDAWSKGFIIRFNWKKGR